MNLQVQSQGDERVSIKVSGKITQRNMMANNEPLIGTLGDTGLGRQILLDLSSVEALDSSGINWLLICQRKVREAGGRLILHSLSPIAKSVIRVLNMQTVFTLADGEEQANELAHGAAK